MIITTPEEIKYFGSNTFIGTIPKMKNSRIIFAEGAKNNILFCEENVCLENSKIVFNGDDSVVFLRKNRHPYKIDVTLYYNNVLHIGENNYFNGAMAIILSEQKHCFIGNDGLFSFGIWVRNADPHLIYSCENKKRINPTRSIFVGDHVWIGQSAFLLKGTQIDSGSIIGAMSVVSGKKIPSNTSWAGNPSKMVKEKVFWEGSCVHKWRKQHTKQSSIWDKFIENRDITEEDYIFQFDPQQEIKFTDLEIFFDKHTPKEIVSFLEELPMNKNRFSHRHNLPTKKLFQGWLKK